MPYAGLRTENGTLLPLESRNVIIGREGDNHYLMDLRSTNGTQLNGKNVVPGRKMPLSDGDRIDFGLGMRVTFVKAALP